MKHLKLIAVYFEDHSLYTKDVVRHYVVGQLYLETKDKIVLRWWIPELIQELEEDSNSEYVTILKSAIIKRWKLNAKLTK